MDYYENLTSYGDFVKGTCNLMCPDSERKLRENERLLHPLERLVDSDSSRNKMPDGSVCKNLKPKLYVADPCKIVKAFSRSAAGHKMPASSELRPFPVLDKTVSYLLKEIACHEVESSSWADRYNFVTDRLRAVRQDMVIQNLPLNECIQLLEPMVKFHVFAGYWLCENPITTFDPTLNLSFLQECIKRLLVMYDMARETNRGTGYQNVSGNPFSNSEEVICENTEHVIGGLYLLINLANPHALIQGSSRLLNANNKCKSCVESEAFQLSLSAWRGNYVRVCQSIQKLPPMLCMAAALHLPSIRRNALRVMSTAYSSKSSKFPMQELQDALLWNSKSQVIKECKHYGIAVDQSQGSDWKICFQKGLFNVDASHVQPSRLHWLDKNIRMFSVDKILA